MAKSFEDFFENFELSNFWLSVSSEDAESWKLFIDLFSNCDIREQHKFLNKIVRLNHLIHSDISSIVCFFLECNFYLSRCQSKSSLLVSPLFQLLSDMI